MKKDIAKFVRCCPTCQRTKDDHQKLAGELQPLSIPLWKWDDITMDFILGLPLTSDNVDSIWVIVDRLTKVARFIPVNTTYPVEKYGENYMKEIVRLHCTPMTITSDRDS